MICITSPSTDIHFNLALEESLLIQGAEDVFLLWKSESSVVVGKHQNALAEINLRFIRENDIHIARRLSGGGAVYHDGGNLNFAFINQGEPGKLVDFKRFISPVIDFLATVGISASHGEKNEILVKDKKISGNAEHVYKNRILHHGTLLFDANLHMLRQSLHITPGKYIDKAVQSNRSSVINLSECLNGRMEREEFSKAFMDYIRKHYRGIVAGVNENQVMDARERIRAKFGTWDWIFGYSPDYEFHSTFKAGQYPVDLTLSIHHGVITECRATGAGISPTGLTALQSWLTDQRHAPEPIKTILENWNYSRNLTKEEQTDLLYSFF